MSQLTFDESLVLFIDQAQDPAEVESAMADLLCSKGYVKESYKPALIAREKNFPTGLDVQGLNAAIPHCDVEHVNEGALCVGVLKTPVPWHRMEDAGATTEVSIVVMLALTDPSSHLAMLRKVIGVIQNQKLITKVVSSTDKSEVFELLKGELID